MNDKMPKHTQGPWTVNINTNDSREAETIQGPDNVRIAATYKVHEHRPNKTAAWYEARANAKLIAAAPDLLEVARQVVLAAEQQEGSIPSDIVSGAYAAILKATGEAA